MYGKNGDPSGYFDYYVQPPPLARC